MLDLRPNEQSARKAAELWVKMIQDNIPDEGKSPYGTDIVFGTVSKMVHNTSPELLSKFCDKLEAAILMVNADGTYPNATLSVDLGPCDCLSEVAAEVGLSCLFPWKTEMQVGSDCVAVSAGFGADWVYYHLNANES